MNVYAITVAFAPASQVARGILEYRKHRKITPTKHIVALGYYPINCAKNNRDIKLICKTLGNIEVWDPKEDLGSSQTQNWVLQQLSDCDYWINVDADSGMQTSGWDWDAWRVMQLDPDCVLMSSMSPLVKKFVESRKIELTPEEIDGVRFAKAVRPIPFNLSLFRTSFIHEIGGLRQLGAKWGDLEGVFSTECRMRGKYHAYLLDHMEDESGKLLQDRQLLEYKDAHLRSMPEDRFPGYYIEYLRWKHPELEQIDTLIPEDTEFQ